MLSSESMAFFLFHFFLNCAGIIGFQLHAAQNVFARYHFYINTTQSAVKVQVESGADLLSGKNVLGSIELKPYDACAIEEKVKKKNAMLSEESMAFFGSRSEEVMWN